MSLGENSQASFRAVKMGIWKMGRGEKMMNEDGREDWKRSWTRFGIFEGTLLTVHSTAPSSTVRVTSQVSRKTYMSLPPPVVVEVGRVPYGPLPGEHSLISGLFTHNTHCLFLPSRERIE